MVRVSHLRARFLRRTNQIQERGMILRSIYSVSMCCKMTLVSLLFTSPSCKKRLLVSREITEPPLSLCSEITVRLSCTMPRAPCADTIRRRQNIRDLFAKRVQSMCQVPFEIAVELLYCYVCSMDKAEYYPETLSEAATYFDRFATKPDNRNKLRQASDKSSVLNLTLDRIVRDSRTSSGGYRINHRRAINMFRRSEQDYLQEVRAKMQERALKYEDGKCVMRIWIDYNGLTKQIECKGEWDVYFMEDYHVQLEVKQFPRNEVYLQSKYIGPFLHTIFHYATEKAQLGAIDKRDMNFAMFVDEFFKQMAMMDFEWCFQKLNTTVEYIGEHQVKDGKWRQFLDRNRVGYSHARITTLPGIWWGTLELLCAFTKVSGMPFCIRPDAKEREALEKQYQEDNRTLVDEDIGEEEEVKSKESVELLEEALGMIEGDIL